MKKMSKKITTLALVGLMVATPLATMRNGLTAHAATTYRRTISIDVPQYGNAMTGLMGYKAYLVNNSTGAKLEITNQSKNKDYSGKEYINVSGTNTYYVQVCFKSAGTGKILPGNCVNTGKVQINETTFKSVFSSLKTKVKTNGWFSLKATLNLEK